MTEELFCDWLASAQPGQSVEYYRGPLLYDRVPSTNALQPRDRVALVALAKREMQAAEDGRMRLVQRRHGEGDYSYIAVKARQRRRAYRTTSVHMNSRPCLSPTRAPPVAEPVRPGPQ
jgi:hypothetical protein